MQDANIVWTQFCDWEQSNIGSSFSETFKAERESLYSTDYGESPFKIRLEESDQRNKNKRIK